VQGSGSQGAVGHGGKCAQGATQLGQTFVPGAQAFEQVDGVTAQVGAERDRSQAVVDAGAKQRGEGVDVAVLAPVLGVEDARDVVDPGMEDGFRGAATSVPGQLEETALDDGVEELDVVISGHDRETAAAPAEVSQCGEHPSMALRDAVELGQRVRPRRSVPAGRREGGGGSRESRRAEGVCTLRRFLKSRKPAKALSCEKAS